jgi:hypothetical protein
MAITRSAEKTDFSAEDPTSICLKLMLEFEGINVDVSTMTEKGLTAANILSGSLPGGTILPYDGCDMEAMLYYVNQDIPVLVRMSDGSPMLIIGFNQQNIVVLDPAKPSEPVYKIGRKDADAMFSENGNHFLTYLYK